ncbi:MAG: hypothetical protein ACRCVP_04495 [Shewanella xiamenensis]
MCYRLSISCHKPWRDWRAEEKVLWVVSMVYKLHLIVNHQGCSGQLNLATALESSQNLRSDSFGLNPAL